MKQLGLLLVAVALAVAAWWWFTIAMPRRERERAQAVQAATLVAERANSLYRWRDAKGILQVTDAPPAGRTYERIGRQPDEGIEVRGESD